MDQELKMTSQQWAFYKKQERLVDLYSQYKHYCKCGHSVVIMPYRDKVICSHCGSWVFKNDKDEFLYRLKEEMKHAL